MNSIILTGASRGLGYELHELLVSEILPAGQRIFISRKPFSEARNGYQYIQEDLERQGGPEKDLDIVTGSKVVLFISNAGTIEPIGKAVETSIFSMESALRVNCLGPLMLAQKLAVKTRNMGARLIILNVSSGAARRPIKGWMAYCVSKAAAIMALDVLAAENEHVTVLHFDPGVMDTKMQGYIRLQTTDDMPDVELFKEFSTNNTLRSPREVAEQIISIAREHIL